MIFFICGLAIAGWLLGVLEFAIKAHKHKYRWVKVGYLVVSFAISAAGLYYFFILSPKLEQKSNNPDPDNYSCYGYYDDNIYEGYEDGYHKFFVDSHGNDYSHYLYIKGEEELASGIDISQRCYFYYSEKKVDLQDVPEKDPYDQYFSGEVVKIVPYESMHYKYFFYVALYTVIKGWIIGFLCFFNYLKRHTPDS